MWGFCYDYKKQRIKSALKLLEKAIYNDDCDYMFEILKFTEGLHVDYIFKTTKLKKNYKMPLINFAARCNSYCCINVLINCGANINKYDSKGWLPIHYVAIYHEPHRNKSLVNLLKSPYVNINWPTTGGSVANYNNVKMNTKGKTAYQLANHYLCYGSCKIIQEHIQNQINRVKPNKSIPLAPMAIPYNPSAPPKE